MKKIIIIGLTGSGKTTLANKLGSLLNIPVYHLDQLFWKEHWRPSEQAEFIAKQETIIKENTTWIMDGSFPRSVSLDLRISHADTIIFLDFPLSTILWRMTKRFFKYYNQKRPDVGSGNKQKRPFTWGDIQYALHYPTKSIYEKIIPLTQTKTVVIIKNNKENKAFFEKISSGTF